MTERKRNLTKLQETRTICDNALRDVRRFIVNAGGFLPPGMVDLNKILNNVSVMEGQDFVKSLLAIQNAIGAPSPLEDVPFAELLRTTSYAVAVPALVTGGENIIFINGDRMKGANKTFMAQALLEELAHTCAREVKLGPLDNMPMTSPQYYPLHSIGMVKDWLTESRKERNIPGPLNAGSITAYRVGCQLLFEDNTAVVNGRHVLYAMPPEHHALEETRALLLQTIFMAKYLGGNTPGTPHQQVLNGLQEMYRGGWSQAHRSGYQKQILGFSMVAPVIADMGHSNRPDQALSRAIWDLYSGGFDELLLSPYANAHSGTVFKSTLDYLVQQT